MNTKALRQKVLDLAIHGKLVPQNPNEESAEVLLKKIREEKAEKIKKGELKADKKDSFIFVGSDKRHYEQFVDGTVKDIEDEIPFEVPEGWAWCRLNELADIARGGSPRPIENYITDSEDGINWIKIGDTAPESKYIISAREKIKPEGKNHSRFVHAGDFLLTNSMSFGRPYILKIDGCIHDGWLVFANIKNCIKKDYLYYALSSDYIYNSFSMVAAGSTVKNLKSDTVKQVLFPLPPIPTQERIIESIAKAFSQIDTLEKENSDLETAIKQAKSKILDLAIHGKLVPQDPNDEPAEELLRRIATSDNRPYEKVNEEPFEIPDSWKWVKLNDLAEIARGGSPRPIQDYITEDKDGINWIKIGDTIEESKYITSAKEKIKPEGKKHSRFVHAGDFLLTNSMSFGRPYILKIDGCIHDGWLVFANIKECLLQDYLYYALSSAYIYETFSNVAAGSTVKNLKSDTVKQVDFPLPPLSEQKRIVGAIENMYEVLDQIQNNLV